MDTKKAAVAAITASVIVVFLASPALAHRKYRPNPGGPPRWVLARHTHVASGSTELSRDRQKTVSHKASSKPRTEHRRRRFVTRHPGGSGRWVR